jgi:pimeloyl-ACP methyl ester carboxylesterase
MRFGILSSFALALAVVLSAGCVPQEAPASPAPATQGVAPDGAVPSSDGAPIHFTSVGTGDRAVVLVHCWGCNVHYWDGQIKPLSQHWRVVAIDLAGHGASGKSRANWTIQAFGEDVRAVVTALGLKRVILVGHSMGGPVVLEAAALMPDRVVGIVPVDTLHDVERVMPEDKKEQLFARMRQDFQGTTQELMRRLFTPTSDKAIVDRVLSDQLRGDPAILIPALEALFRYQEAPALERIKVPIRAINADILPTDFEANRRHAPQFDAVIMKGVGHWLMLERPEEFNADLVSVIEGMHL